MNTSSSLPEIKKSLVFGGIHIISSFFTFSACQSKAKTVASPSFGVSSWDQMNSLPRKHSKQSVSESNTGKQPLLASLCLQGTAGTQARRPSELPFPAATLYVNCTPLTFIVKSADLNSWDEGWKAVFTQGTRLPSLYGNETWSLFTAGLWNPRWGVAGCRGRSLRLIHSCSAKPGAWEAWILILLCPQPFTCITASRCI